MNIIDPLVEEHQVIKKILFLLAAELDKIKNQRRVDSLANYISMDFIRTYTDLVHHGKEENILFRKLGGKNLSAELSVVMNELLAEHKYSRSIAGRWFDATEKYFDGEDTSQEIIGCLQELTTFYPQHIIKENEHFFGLAMEYFTGEEQSKMMQEFEEFDNKILHWKYRKVESALEERLANPRAGICPR